MGIFVNFFPKAFGHVVWPKIQPKINFCAGIERFSSQKDHVEILKGFYAQFLGYLISKFWSVA